LTAALHAFAIATALLGLGGGRAEFMDPAAWVSTFNERALHVGAELSCSLVVGWLDLTSGEGRFCQAGHPHPLGVDRNGAVRRLGDGGLPVGAMDGVRYVATDFRLAPGERLVLHSDGVTDCVDLGGRPFGQDRLEQSLATAAGHDIHECLRAVSRALDDWRGKAAHDDDVSLLILEPEATA